MQGNNKITLNGASMTQAVQFWLVSRFREGCCPTVTSVTWNGAEFVVHTDGKVATMTPIQKEAHSIRAREDC